MPNIVQQYYEITERETIRISYIWKALHLAMLAAAIISGYAAAYNVGKVIEAFGNNCVLDAHIVFTTHHPLLGDYRSSLSYPISTNYIGNSTEAIGINVSQPYLEILNILEMIHPDFRYFLALNSLDRHLTQWGSNNLCFFCEAAPVISMIFGMIWGAFIVIVPRGGAGDSSDILSQPWKIVIPFSIFTVLFIGVQLSAAIFYTNGIKLFCSQFYTKLGNDRCVRQIDFFTLQYEPYILRNFYTSQLWGTIFIYIGVLSWILQLFILFLRWLCFIDFELRLVTIVNHEV